jgi:pimeloyl-ACP methyl ester carboxylesterase
MKYVRLNIIIAMLLAALFGVVSAQTTISNGYAVNSLSGSTGSELAYKISVPSGQRQIYIYTVGGLGASGDVDIYVKYGAVPTASIYDFRSVGNSNNESVLLNNPPAGNWFINVRAYSSFSNVSFFVLYGDTGAVVVDAPVISPGSRTVTGPVSVTMSCATSGATIVYTTDGSDPNIAGSQIYNGATYSGPFTVSSSTNVNARAFKSGMNNSAVAGVSYTIGSATVATPVISPGSMSSTSAVSVTMTCATSGATIRYTVDGSDPTVSSTSYGGAFTLNSSATVKARAFKSGVADSAVASASYTINVSSGPSNDNFANRATISAAGGTVSGSNVNATKESSEPAHAGSTGNKSVWWTWTPASSGTAIISTDGSSFDTVLATYTGAAVNALTAQASNDDYTSGIRTSRVSFSVSAGTTYQIAVDGYSGASGSISLTVTPPTTVSSVATPVISPGSMSSTSAVSVTMSCATSGATIRYTTDGSDPTASSTSYGGAFTLNSSATVKARAFKSGMSDSAVASASYTINISSGLSFSGLDWEGIKYTGNVSQGSWTPSISGNVTGFSINDTSWGMVRTLQTYSLPRMLNIDLLLKLNSTGTNPDGARVGFGETWPNYSSGRFVGLDFIKGEVRLYDSSVSGGIVRTLPVYTANEWKNWTISILANGTLTVQRPGLEDVTYAPSTALTGPLRVMLSCKDTADGFSAQNINISQNTTVSSVATPVISPSSMSSTSAVSVTMSCETSGATIRYTTDGSDPTASSMSYGGAFTLNSSATVKARAFKSGMSDSAVASTSYTITSVPSNNNFASRETIGTAGGTVSGSNINATKESGEPAHAGNGGGKSVWWTWTSSATGTAVISTVGSNFDTCLGVYTGNSVNALTVRAYDDDGGDNHTSQVNLNVTAGTTYQIAVDGYNGESGSIILTVTPTSTAAPVATPVISPGSMSTTSAVSVTMSCATSGATIRYTIDGSEPTSSSAAYFRAIPVTITTTLKAKAFKSGLSDSATATTTYTLVAATPAFSPGSGSYTVAKSVTMTCATKSATIRYTMDGSEPTNSSPVYSSAISVAATTMLKAKAFRSGMSESATATATYTLTVATPTFTPVSGSYPVAKSVTIRCTTSGATIRYTIDGSEPTSSSNAYSGAISVPTTTTLKAKAFKSGLSDSATATANYILPVAAPSFSPGSGSYTSAQSVTISCATSGATIRYTTNGSAPTSSSPAYSGAISIAANTTLKAKAFKPGSLDSAIATATYTLPVAPPTFSPGSGSYNSAKSVTISCATSGATIRYTIDGTEPSSRSPAYSGAISVATNTTLKAKAFKSGVTTSATAEATYTFETRIVLLLHGMNSSSDTWDDLLKVIKDNNNSPVLCPVITAKSLPISDATKDSNGVYWYRISFGAYDGDSSSDNSSGRGGLEGVHYSIFDKRTGDFESFNGSQSLAAELQLAIAYIRQKHTTNPRIMLVGHSRGGLAARAFLQIPASSSERNAVSALLTVGTPHRGSPLGRIYPFLNDNPSSLGEIGRDLVRATKPWPVYDLYDSPDWFLVDDLRIPLGGLTLIIPIGLDVRRPTIDDLSSDKLVSFNLGAVNLPTQVKYGNLVYSGAPIGKLSSGFGGIVDIFTGSTWGDLLLIRHQLTSAAQTAILNGSTRDSYVGDGIVPETSQSMQSLHFTGTPSVVTEKNDGSVLHTGEPKETADIRAMMNALTGWWQ